MQRFVFRILLPALTVALLQLVLMRVEQGRRDIEDRESPGLIHLHAYEPTPILELVIMLQWPVVAVGNVFAHGSLARWLTVTLAGTIYWFLIAWWIDARRSPETPRPRSKLIRRLLIAATALVVPVLCLFLAVDIFVGWYHLVGTAYGFTIWCTLMSWILLTELNIPWPSQLRLRK